MLRSLAVAATKAGKMAASSATQTTYIYPKSMGGYIIDLLEKLNEIKGLFGTIKEELSRGQQRIDYSETSIENMGNSINNLSNTMDTVGSRVLETSVTTAQRNLQIQKVKQEIGAKKKKLRQLMEQSEYHTLAQQEKAIVALKKERDQLEQRLVRINNDIETVYEEMFEAQQKLTALKDKRMTQQDNEDMSLVALREKSASFQQKKQQLISIAEAGQGLNMQDLYISAAQLRQMQIDIEQLKHKQILLDKHMQAQMEERDFLKETADEIVQKVYRLEKIVRKEKGDYNPESPLTVQPALRQDLGGPKLWYQPPSFTVEQLKRLMAEEYQNHPVSQNWTDEPGTSGYGDETIENNISLDKN